MKKPTLQIAFAFYVLSAGASAAEAPAMTESGASAPMTPKQEKMATCDREAGDRKGDERKDFVQTCLSSKPVSQPDKMRSCNQQATGKKGDERKQFMKECLGK